MDLLHMILSAGELFGPYEILAPLGAGGMGEVYGKQVKGGQYGTIPSLTKLDTGDNLIYTTDFRKVYATMIVRWMGLDDTRQLLKGNFDTFDMFQRKA